MLFLSVSQYIVAPGVPIFSQGGAQMAAAFNPENPFEAQHEARSVSVQMKEKSGLKVGKFFSKPGEGVK